MGRARTLHERGRPRWWHRGRVGLVVGALVAGLIACGPADRDWATEAEAYADVLQQAYAAGPTNVAQFFTTTFGFLPGAPDLIAPATAEGCQQDGCDPWPVDQRAVILTRPPHSWLVESAPRGAMAEYADAHDLAWTEVGDPASDGTLTRAAAILAWGLMDEPYLFPQSVASFTCDGLAEDTSAHAAGKACAASGG